MRQPAGLAPARRVDQVSADAENLKQLLFSHFSRTEGRRCSPCAGMKTLFSTPRAAGPLVRLALVGGGLALLAGCATEPASRVVSAPPPPPPGQAQAVVVPSGGTAAVTTTQSVPAGAVVVTQAPPAAQQEPVLERPSSRHVWIPGYWTYRDSRYVWISGRWELPPRDGSVWVAPRWVPEGGAYRFYEGYWE